MRHNAAYWQQQADLVRAESQHTIHLWKLRLFQAEQDGRRSEEVSAILDEEIGRLKAQEAHEVAKWTRIRQERGDPCVWDHVSKSWT